MKAAFVTVPMDDYMYCRLCHVDVGKANDGLRLHAEQKHPTSSRFGRLYLPSEPRHVLQSDQDE